MSDKNLRPVVLGILIVVAGFATFNIFNKFAPGEVNTTEETVAQTDENKDKNTEMVADTHDEAVLSQSTSKTQSTTTNWTANNYEQGDIESGSSYTVVRGDTLWEISEAAYGSGYDWHKIEEANDIKYLPNGNPLIVPGQVLIIPQN